MKLIKIPKEYKYLSVFLTMRCNLNCSFCLNNLNNKLRNKFKEMSGKQWVRALNKIELRSEVPITLTGGEPMMHPDFIYIINNLKPSLNIDILTNFYYKKVIRELIKNVNPKRLHRNSPYPSIRVSYHPEQMDARELIKNVKKAQKAGFDIGVYSVLYPSNDQLSAINQMQFRCREAGIDFRLKEFVGKYKGELYGDYSRYPDSVFQLETKSCLCKNSDLLFGPDGNIYKCHRDLYAEENPIDNIMNPNLQIEYKFRFCDKYGHCHSCDVKLKSNYKQRLGHTSVEIENVK